MTRAPLTREGAERLREELSRLKKQDRPGIIAAIAEARAHGDLRENAEYHAAREQQGFIERRIHELESVLASARIIDPGMLEVEGRIVFGARVTLCEERDDACQVSWQIVGELEASAREGRLAITAPLARALIGRAQGERVEVDTPEGKRKYRILDICYE